MSVDVAEKWKNKLETENKGIQDDKNSIRLFYDEWSDSYDICLDTWQYAAPRRCIDLMLKHSNNNNKNVYTILDVGCGTGLVGTQLSQHYSDKLKLCPLKICSMYLFLYSNAALNLGWELHIII